MSNEPSDDGYEEVGAMHVRVMQEMLDAFRAGDPEAHTRAMDPRIVIVQPDSTPFGGTFHGIQGVRAMVERMGQHWTRRWIWVRRHPCGRFVVNHEEVVWTATATGKEVTLETVSFYRFRKRRIARVDVFTRTPHLFATLSP